jgi:hypothetical protein
MNLDLPYQEIAKIAVSHAPAGRTRIQIPAKIQDDWAEISYDYWDSKNNQKWFEIGTPGLGLKITRFLREIRKTMKQDGRDPWSCCTFTLFPEGKFTFDVEYDD